jgi:hypothetical protein
MAEDVCRTERNRRNQMLPSTSPDRPIGGRPRSGGGRGPGGGFGGLSVAAGPEIDDPEVILQYRRRLKTALSAVQKGLGIPSKTRAAGVAGLFIGEGEEEKVVRNMSTALSELLTKSLDDTAPAVVDPLKPVARESVLARMDKKIDETIRKLKDDLSKIRGAGGAEPAPGAKQPPAT